MISSWPKYSEDNNFAKDEADIELVKEAIRGIRNIRTGMNVSPGRKATIYVVSSDNNIRETFECGEPFIKSLAYASEVIVKDNMDGISDDAVSVVIPGANIYMPFAELVDIAQEIERLGKEKAKLEGEIKRASGMLANEKFISKAPKAKVDEEKQKLAKYEQMLSEVTKQLDKLSK